MMRLSGVTIFLYLFFFGFFVSAQDSTAVIKGEPKQWHPISITFNGPETSENANPNPFLYYRLNVTFSNKDTSYLVPGFYAADGDAAETSAKNGNKWRVYFTPDQEGVWTYEVSFRQGNNVAINANPEAGSPTSFDGLRGSFSVSPNDKLLPDMRAHGRMMYVGEHYLQFAESGEYYIKGGSDSPENFLGYYEFDDTRDHGGNPNALHNNQSFVSQGVTYNYHNDGLHHYDPHLGDWQEGDPTWQGEKGKRIIGAINYLGSESVNVQYMLTNNVNGDGREVYMWTDYGTRNRYDVSKLAQWEIVFKHMQKKGIVLHLILQETENDNLLDGGNLGTNRKLYYRELIARFAHHNSIIWNLGEENTNNHGQRDDFAQYIHQNDPYGHFLTVQTNIGQQGDVYTPFLGKDYFDGAAIQEDYWEVHDETNTWINRSAETGRKWVVFCDEIGPFQSGVSPDSFSNNHHTIRHEVLYANLFAGGAGNEWYFGYDLPHNDLDCEDFRSRDRMWDYTRYSVAFWKSFLPLTRMQNLNNLINRNDSYAFGNPGEIYTVYIPNGEEIQINFDSLTTAYRVRWFDPRNGGFLQEGSVDSVQGPGWVSLGLPPENPNPEEGNDWIAVVGVPNMAPVFQLSTDKVKLNENFSTTEQITVSPMPVPSDEQNQIVTYSLFPSSVSFANVEIDSLTGSIQITAVPEQTGSQEFTVIADDGQEVNNIYEQNFTLTISPPQPPIAVLKATPISGIAPLIVSFDASLSDDANSPIVSYLWNFGDGVIADTSNITHVYSTPGLYTASLTVVDEDGMIHSQDTTIEVREVSENIVLVVGNSNLNPGDQAVFDSLQSWGYNVLIENQNTIAPGEVSDAQMILISSTVNSSTINTKYATVDIPVLTWEPYLFDDMKMTGSSVETHFGHLPGESAFIIDSAATEIISTPPQLLSVTTSPQTIGWGRPSSSAIPIASLQEDHSQLGVFAYRTGATMEGMLAPAIRIGMFWQDITPIHSTPEAWGMFRDLVCWATNCKGDTITDEGIKLVAIPDQLNEEGASVAIAVEILESAESSVSITITGLPQGLTFNPLRRIIEGNLLDEVGVYPIQIIAVDDDSSTSDAYASFNWVIFTPKPNLPPQLEFIADQLNEQGDMVSLFLSGSDIDGDSLFYVIDGLPIGLVTDSVSGEIYGVIADSVGTYQVRADVWDNGEPSENSYITFIWEVIPPIPNQPPVLTPILNQSFEEGEIVNIQLNAIDPDEEDSVFFQAFGLPNGLTVDSMTHSISGQLSDTIGTYSITLIAQDNGIPIESDTTFFSLTIEQKALEALLVVGNNPLNIGDAAIEGRLKDLGYEVEILLDTETETNSDIGKELIFTSSTVASWAVGDKFTNSEVPIICAESYLYDDLKLVNSVANLGNVGGQLSLNITDSSHVASAGFTGEVNTTVVTQEKGWGKPNSDAKIIAHLNIDDEKATIFSYDTNAQLYGLNAPAKRMGFFLRDETAAFLTEEGWALFDAAVCWAAGCRTSTARKGRQATQISFKAFPNPVSDILKVEFNPTEEFSLKLYDMMGKVWIQQDNVKNHSELNVINLPSGIYIMQLITDSETKNEKILKL